MSFMRHLGRTIRKPFNRSTAFGILKDFHSEPHDIEAVVDKALDFGSTGYYRVGIIQIRSEIISLAKAVEAIKPKRILEIGTARGGTLFIWSHLAIEQVITCDIDDPGPRRELYPHFPPNDSNCKVEAFVGDSHDPAFRQRVESALGGEQVDFLFIDGDHTETGVTADYNDYKHLVCPGGLIAFHDIVELQPFDTNQVYHLWKHLRQSEEVEEFVNDPEQCGCGIGIVRVPA